MYCSAAAAALGQNLTKEHLWAFPSHVFLVLRREKKNKGFIKEKKKFDEEEDAGEDGTG